MPVRRMSPPLPGSDVIVPQWSPVAALVTSASNWLGPARLLRGRASQPEPDHRRVHRSDQRHRRSAAARFAAPRRSVRWSRPRCATARRALPARQRPGSRHPPGGRSRSDRDRVVRAAPVGRPRRPSHPPRQSAPPTWSPCASRIRRCGDRSRRLLDTVIVQQSNAASLCGRDPASLGDPAIRDAPLSSGAALYRMARAGSARSALGDGSPTSSTATCSTTRPVPLQTLRSRGLTQAQVIGRAWKWRRLRQGCSATRPGR